VSRLVAVTAPRRTLGDRERVALASAYVTALADAGLVPLVVPPHLAPEAAGDVADAVVGLVLTGGEDVAPARYGAVPHPELDAADTGRDAIEIALFEAAQARRLPVLAICRGIQLVNVALGGTLFQHLPEERPGPINHADPHGTHELSIAPETLMHRTLQTLQTSVNSRHHQAVRDLAPGLVASAWAPDGVIEGAESAFPDAPWLLAVQWHPEDFTGDALFRGFADAVR